jgi:hypothetical protein
MITSLTSFRPLFSLEIQHDYYGRACPDVGFLVPDDAASLVRGGRMLIRRLEGALQVLYMADEAGRPQISAAGRTLRIGLVVRDAQFANITEGFNPAGGALHYRNTGVATALDDPPGTIVLRDASPQLWKDGAFGVVDVAITPDLYTAAPTYRIHFKARIDTFRYYVVVRGFPVDLDQLAIRDASGSPALPDKVRFAKVPAAELTADEQARANLLATDGAKVLLFRSVAPVARRERSTGHIQLVRNTEPLIERLPQPGKDRASADLIVHLSKSKP